jgi:predicted unusual protein kinase regulating ubiquinone biosynthesis (AarF/ABC1/UbiB family)
MVVLTRCVILPGIPFRRNQPTRPERMRAALEQLGGAWIKLGQMLALRLDLLPAAYCDELFKLLNDVQPFPYADVREIVQQELGAPPEAVFRSFETKPFASASIGQVHRAELKTGEAVAVKVQRPHIRETMRADIDLMYQVAALLDLTHFFGATHSRHIIDEFARWTKDELDYLNEARQSVQLWENARDDPLERIARVYRRYTTSRVLTSELIDGIPLIDIVVAVRAGDHAYLQGLEQRGYSLETVVRHLDWNMLNQVYVYGYFHADLHPANLYVLPGNAIGYVDFGMIGQLPGEVRDSLTRYSWLLFQRDVEAAVKELMRWLSPTVDTNAAVARQELARLHEAFLYDIGDVGDGSAEAPAPQSTRNSNPYSKLGVEIMDAVRRNHLSMSPSIVAYLKMLVTLGAIRYQLATDYDLAALARQFFGGLIRQRGQEWLDPRFAIGRIYGTSYRIQQAIGFVEYLEDQQPLLAGLIQSYYGVGHGLHTLYRRVVGLGTAAILVGAVLYFVLIDPKDASRFVPAGFPFELVHWALLALLIVIIAVLISHVRRFVDRR